MWRLLNKLFGWDYIVWKNTCDGGIARIYKDPTGRVYYWRYRNISLVDYINSPADVKVWLTCKPEKYLTKD